MDPVGILALQGGFSAHGKILDMLGQKYTEVRTEKDLHCISSLIIPGGESTVMADLLVRFGMKTRLKQMISEGFPVFGTCAGMILLASSVMPAGVEGLGGLEIGVSRNAYGSQIHSFETTLEFNSCSGTGRKIKALFIRAPKITGTGCGVLTLAEFESEPVLVRQKNIIAASFHPELCAESAVHEYFIKKII